jgi:hypothetical protein
MGDRVRSDSAAGSIGDRDTSPVVRPLRNLLGCARVMIDRSLQEPLHLLLRKIHTSERLETMTNAAYFSSDLRVRAVALEIWRARDNFPKTSEHADVACE